MDQDIEFQQERTILALTCAICEEMNKQKVSRTELAKRIGVTRGRVSQVLGGANISVRTLSNILAALGVELKVQVGPIEPCNVNL